MIKIKKPIKSKKKKPCRHYWIVEPAIPATSLGICKYCGVTKEFTNKLHGYSFVDTVFGKSVSDNDGTTREKSEDEYV
jgi:hypothetical protein